MSTPLMFGAAFLQKKLTCYLYPHILSFNPATYRWQVEQNKWKLIPFYIATIGVVVFLGMFLCIIQILKYIFSPNSLSGFIVGFMTTLVFLSAFCWAYSISSILYGNDIVCYMNSLVDFEERILSIGFKQLKMCHFSKKKLMNRVASISESGISRPKLTWQYYFNEVYSQVGLLIFGYPCDLFGLAANLTVFYLLSFGWFVVPVGIYFNLEPYYYTLKDLGLLDRWPAIITVSIRTVLSYICVLETCRTLMLFCPIVQHSLIYNKCMEILTKLPLTRVSFQLYIQVLLLHQWGDWMIKFAYAVNLGTGMYLCIIFNIFTVVGWKVFPISLYLLCVPITIIIYILLLSIPPMCVEIHHTSLNLVKHQWPKRAVTGECKDMRLTELKMILRRLQPITFHTGDVATLDNETKRNYFGHILYYTMSLLLLFESSVKEATLF